MSENTLAKVPPHSQEAEIACLSVCLQSNTSLARVVEKVVDQEFYDIRHQTIYKVIVSLFDQNIPVDIVTVTEKLDSAGNLDKIGGINTLYEILSFLPSRNIDTYIKIVKDKALLRLLIETSRLAIEEVYASEENVDEVIDTIERRLFDITQLRISSKYKTLRDLLLTTVEDARAVIESPNLFQGLSTGHKDIDKHLGGLGLGDLIILAARPAMGKTALALDIALRYMEKNKQDENTGVLFFSLEMSGSELAQRLIASCSKIPIQHVRGSISDAERKQKATNGKSYSEYVIEKIFNASVSLAKYPMTIDDTPSISITELRSKARSIMRSHPYQMLIIDHIQLLTTSTSSGPNVNRNQELSYISRSLKAIAKELHVAVVALSQLSRGVESRTDKRPLLSDLRESGAIEQDADIVAMLYREDYYKVKDSVENPVPSKDQGEIAEFIIQKHRNGPTGTEKLTFLKQYARFEDYIPEAHYVKNEPEY